MPRWPHSRPCAALVPRTQSDKERINILYFTVQDGRVSLSNNTGTVAESRHAHSLRLSRPLTHISPLTSPNLPAEPRPAGPQLTPGPMDRSISAKNSMLLVIVPNVGEELLDGQGDVALLFVDACGGHAYRPKGRDFVRAIGGRSWACEGPRESERAQSSLSP